MRQLKINQRFTNRDSIALEKYFKDLSRQHAISPDEEVRLSKRIKMGDMAAMDLLVKANLRFVVSVAKQYEGYGILLEDLISEGNIGLIKAARRYDGTKGYKFISYAVFWIRQCILKALNEQARLIRLPANQAAQLKKLQLTFAKLEQQFGHMPTDEVVSEAMNMEPSEVREALRNGQRPVSMDAPLQSDEKTPLSSMIVQEGDRPEEGMMLQSMKEEISRYLDKLKKKEAEILRMHFGLDGTPPMRFEEIGEVLGVGRERVRQIKVQAVRKLRQLSRGKKLEVFLS